MICVSIPHPNNGFGRIGTHSPVEDLVHREHFIWSEIELSSEKSRLFRSSDRSLKPFFFKNFPRINRAARNLVRLSNLSFLIASDAFQNQREKFRKAIL